MLKGRKSIFTVLSKSQKKNFGSLKRILGALCEKKRGLLLFIPKRMLNGDKIACSRHFLLRGLSFFMGGRGDEEISEISFYFSYPTKISQKFFAPQQKTPEIFRTPPRPSNISYPTIAS